jgi:hypothetical protein
MRILCGLLLCGSAALALAAGKDAPLFDADTNHLWNRVHRALHVANPDRGIDDQEPLEPNGFTWPESRFLTPRASPKAALEVLDLLLAAGPKAAVKDPLKRAVFQHDLWAAFADSTGPVLPTDLDVVNGWKLDGQPFTDQGDSTLPRLRERRALQRRLVQVLRLAAVTEDEIKALPDNLADAVRSGRFPATFNPSKPEQAFLPPDLLAGDGPWVVVSNPTQARLLGAPAHLATVKGRSVFVVLLRLPDGRKATERFLLEVGEGKLPALPKGTQTALLRRMLLIDDQCRLRPTTLTESVQLRTFSGDEEEDTGAPTVFKLARNGLFAGKGNGLQPLDLKGNRCMGCHFRHDGNGVRSIQSLYMGDPRKRALAASNLDEQTRRSIAWTERSYSWGLLQGMWEADPPK